MVFVFLAFLWILIQLGMQSWFILSDFLSILIKIFGFLFVICYLQIGVGIVVLELRFALQFFFSLLPVIKENERNRG